MIRRLKYWIFYTFGKQELEQTDLGHGNREERCYLRLWKWSIEVD